MRLRTFGFLVALLIAVFALSVVIAGEIWTYPNHHSIAKPPPELSAESIVIGASTNQRVAGWMIRGKPGIGAILLLHGLRADRRAMIDRARFFKRLGYSILLIDLPAHGESSGARVTYGLNEAKGVRAALTYLSQTLPAERIGVIGVSLGAASLVLSKPSPAPSAVILESMFSSLGQTVTDRLTSYIGPIGAWIAPVFLWQLQTRFGIHADQLRPISELPSLHSPVLIACGAIDRFSTLAECRRIYASANEPKTLWVIEGAAHIDLYAFDPGAYELAVSAFFAKYLGQG